IEDFLELGQRRLELALHVVGLREPVLRVVRERAVRKRLHEARERLRRILVAPCLKQLERGLIVVLVRAREPGAARGRGFRVAEAAGAGRGVRAEALIRGAEPASRLRLERLQPLVDVEIQLALPLRSALGLETQRLDLAAQRLRIRAQLLELIRDLYQAFVVADALDAYQARLEILQPQIHRIVRRRDRAACREQAEGDDADREDDERASHGRFLEVGAIAETLTACKRSRLG